MKKRFIYIAASFLLVFTTGFILLSSKESKAEIKNSAISQLLPRNELLAKDAEWNIIWSGTEKLINKIKENPADKKSLLSLSSIYIQEGRITGNLSYYNEAALRSVNEVLKIEAENFEALTFKSMILLSQHRFTEGLAVAQQIQKKYPYNAFVYGLMVDANVELGNYPAALEAAEKMISIRPDLRSYSRIAYLREIHGDIPGAIDAMKMAIEAGAPGDETTEWCRIQLAKLYEQRGNIAEAKIQFMIAGNNRPNYAYAKAGLAGIAVVEKDYANALSLYMQADSLIPDHTFKEGIAEVYQLMGQPEKAKMIAEEILLYMKNMNGNSGQNEDHEMAHAYMGVEDHNKALEYALAEYNRRPENIEVNQTAAIVYYKKGDYANALQHIEKALKTNCKNPELLCYAGLIYAKNSDTQKARSYLELALKQNPSIPSDLDKESREILKTL